MSDWYQTGDDLTYCEAIGETLVPETPMPCPEDGCNGTLRRKWSKRFKQYFYGCTNYPPCRGAIGCHPDGRMLGIPANQETRDARQRAHAAFDRLWKGGDMRRAEAYALAADMMGVDEMHIAELDKDQCEKLISTVEKFHARNPAHKRRSSKRRHYVLEIKSGG